MKDPCDTFDPNCYGCQLRAKGIGFSAAAMPTRQNSVPPRAADPAWERGVAGEHRPDGSFIPYLNATTSEPIGVKEFGEKRHIYEQAIQDLHSPDTKVSVQ